MSSKERAQSATYSIFEKATRPSQKDINELCSKGDSPFIHIRSSFDEIYIYDVTTKKYLISQLYLREKTVAFGLFTKDEEGYHPLFHAQFFKELALDYFSKKVNIGYIKGKYLPISVNYKQFLEKFNQDKDKLEAAQSMWSTESNKSLGYVIKNLDDIKVFHSLDDSGDDTVADVRVLYRKNNL
jgi:hypothetical protein